MKEYFTKNEDVLNSRYFNINFLMNLYFYNFGFKTIHILFITYKSITLANEIFYYLN